MNLFHIKYQYNKIYLYIQLHNIDIKLCRYINSISIIYFYIIT